MNNNWHARSRVSDQWTSGGLLALILLLLMAVVPQVRADEAEARVVYHADFSDPRRFSAMLTSINNMVNHYANEFIDYDVRIVFVAHGVRFVTDDKLAGTPFVEDKQLAEQRENLRGRLLTLAEMHNVKLELCNITRSQIGLAEDKLYSQVALIPSGVVRIAQLQQEEGFAYIKIE
jgi:intracellular sulfur oxidation DsrE/DsrF family protein